jgi:hypothetical protein
MFDLLPEDIEFLRAQGYEWETLNDGSNSWVLIPSFRVPTGYNYSHVNVAVQISPQYPDAQLDMVYCFPHLSRTDGKTIAALAQHVIDGRSWQRWSRHRTPENPWRIGVDSLATHLILVEEWFAKEIRKN